MEAKVMRSGLTCYSLRVEPGQELVSTLMKFVKDANLHAAFVMTCVGSVSKAKLRMARGGEAYSERIRSLDAYYEILSLVGTLSPDDDSCHLHVSLGDAQGHVIGGHVMGDMIIYTTAEVVLGECEHVTFDREFDARTGYKELDIKPRDVK